jgi:hypothetical protein
MTTTYAAMTAALLDYVRAEVAARDEEVAILADLLKQHGLSEADEHESLAMDACMAVEQPKVPAEVPQPLVELITEVDTATLRSWFA